MAHSRQQAGDAAQQTLGWWHSWRFVILRRLVQLSIVVLFLSGPLWGVWVLRGNYSSSTLLDSVPLTDPLIFLESLLSGVFPAWMAILGVCVVSLLYAVIGKRVFCSWVCPVNPITDLAAWIRRRYALPATATLPRSLRYSVLVVILAGSALSGTLLWEGLNPVALLGRELIFGLSAGIWLIVALFFFDLLVLEHGWCGHLCPIGAVYSLIGRRGLLRVDAQQRERCDRCMDCLHVCPEPQVLRDPILTRKQGTQITSSACLNCGRCIDICPQQVFRFTLGLQQPVMAEKTIIPQKSVATHQQSTDHTKK